MTFEALIEQGDHTVAISESNELRVTGAVLEAFVGQNELSVDGGEESISISVSEDGALAFTVDGSRIGSATIHDLAALEAEITAREDLSDNEQTATIALIDYVRNHGWSINVALALFQLISGVKPVAEDS